MKTTRHVFLFIALLAFLPTVPTALAQNEDAWLLIDTRQMTLSVLQGDTVRAAFSNISIGRAGTTSAKRRRDGKTPLGEFHISRVTSDTPFHRFFGLDYPSREHAERALQSGTIDRDQYRLIRRAIASGQVPPQSTPLGGYIGIHGLGDGNTAVHADFNWTHGCIALTNEQIDRLSDWIRIGMRVVIR